MSTHLLAQVAFLVVGILVAEMARGWGRTLVGLLAGLRVSHVALGVGPALLRARVAGVVWTLNVLPLGVQAVLMPPPARRFMRLRLWLLTVGGPLGCAGVIVAIRALGVPSVGDAGRLWPLQAISTGAFLILLGRLFPM